MGEATFNLIEAEWIPVVRASGKPDSITPYEVTQNIDPDTGKEDPIVKIAAVRPDFNGALAQFLIGLVQMTMAPANESAWDKKFDKPPTPEELKERFKGVMDAFNLDGDEPRFMQEKLTPTASEEQEAGKKKRKSKKTNEEKGVNPICWLLMDAPTDSTEKGNRDFFVKRRFAEQVCYPCCATALYMLQANAPSGGKGHYTSLRGGGPLTTLLIDEISLWRTIWANVLLKKTFENNVPGNKNKTNIGDMFPWMLTGKKSLIGKSALPKKANPLHIFWGMPNRIDLLFEGKKGICGICNNSEENVVRQYRKENKGISYKDGNWRHSLTPYRKDKNKILAMRMQTGGITYRHWEGLIANPLSPKNIMTALPVYEFFTGDYLNRPKYRLWAFGYNVEGGQKNAKCYYDSIMPIVKVEKEKADEFNSIIVNEIIPAADRISYSLKKSLAFALFGRRDENHKWRLNQQAKDPKSKSKPDEDDKIDDNKALMENIGQSFWQNSERQFYEILDKISGALNVGNHADSMNQIKNEWFGIIRKEAIKLFETWVETCSFGESDIKHSMLAKQRLISWIYTPKVQNDTTGNTRNEKGKGRKRKT